eukprot:3863230-Prymnesium_polylepis.1
MAWSGGRIDLPSLPPCRARCDVDVVCVLGASSSTSAVAMSALCHGLARRCRMTQGRSVNKKKSVLSSNAVCTPEPWRFERPRLCPGPAQRLYHHM